MSFVQMISWLLLHKEKVAGVVIASQRRGSEWGRYTYIDAEVMVDGKVYEVPAAGAEHINGRKRGLSLYTTDGTIVNAVKKTFLLFRMPVRSWLTEVTRE
jgi:hypothetical protein